MSPFLTHSLAVAIGGGAGAWLRFLCSRLQSHFWPDAVFPLATLSVNITGCLVMGILYRLFSGGAIPQHPTLWLLLATGLLGGFTTFSAFALEWLQLWQRGQVGQSLLYLGLSLAGTLTAVAFGWWVTGTVIGMTHD